MTKRDLEAEWLRILAPKFTNISLDGKRQVKAASTRSYVRINAHSTIADASTTMMRNNR